MVTRADVASKIEGQGGKHLGAGATSYPTKENTNEMHSALMAMVNEPSNQWKKDQVKLKEELVKQAMQAKQASKN